MGVIIRFDVLQCLATLRSQYEEIKQIDLTVEPSMIGMPIIAGGVDVTARRAQFSFMEKIICLMHPNILESLPPPSLEQYIAHLTATKFCLAAAWYIQSQLTKSSKLYKIIDQSIGITKYNKPDKKDRDECFAAAFRLVKVTHALDHANLKLTAQGLESFSEIEWSEFTCYIQQQRVAVQPSRYKTAPFTSLTEPLFKASFTYAGSTLGYLGADLLNQSTQGKSMQYQVTALVGSSLLVLGRAGPTGIALFAPVIATRLISSFCTISLTHILGTTMGILGKNVGTVVGYPLDLCYRLIWSVCSNIGNYHRKPPKSLMLSGTQISNGRMLIDGIEVQITPVGKKPPAHIKHLIEFDKEGTIFVNGKSITLQKNVLPADLLEDLRTHLTNPAPDKPLEPTCFLEMDEEEAEQKTAMHHQ